MSIYELTRLRGAPDIPAPRVGADSAAPRGGPRITTPETRERPRHWKRNVVRYTAAADFAVASAAAAVAFNARFGGGFTYREGVVYTALSLVLPALWVICVALVRGYEPRYVGAGLDEFRRVAVAAIVLTALVGTLSWATAAELARGYVSLALPLVTGGSLGARLLVRRWLRSRHRRGQFLDRLLVVGHVGPVEDLVGELRRHPASGVRPAAACIPEAHAHRGQILGVPVLGHFADVPQVARTVGADAVAVLSCPELEGTALRQLSWALERTHIELLVGPGLVEVAQPRLTIRPLGERPVLHVERPEFTGGRRLAKSLFDRILTLAALVPLSLLMVVIAALVRCTSKGPALFRQTRVGTDGREFTLYKFRTMCVDAEQRRAELHELNLNADGLLFKVRRDPRVTRVGSVLRRWSLDELPQLFNVLRGDMSLVGPRPPLPQEVAAYADDVRRRLLVKPGLTGLWQVSGRSNLSWEESVRLDLRYVENWSLALDLHILWRTASAVVRGSGAY